MCLDYKIKNCGLPTLKKFLVVKLFLLSKANKGLNHSKKEWYKPNFTLADFFTAWLNSPTMSRPGPT